MEYLGIAQNSLSDQIAFALFACFFAFLWAPLLTHFLYKYKIVRQSQYDPSLALESRRDKVGVPVMGGLLVIVTVALITFTFNWDRHFTWMPIGVMLLSSALGGIDDLLNIFGTERRNRKLSQTLTLIRVHKLWYVRLWLIITLPWEVFKRAATMLSRHPGKGVHVHEKLLLQFLAGAAAAWWIYFKLGENWRVINIPFDGSVSLGFWLIPLIIFAVMFTANAVNISDGMDGLAGGMLITTFGALTLLSWINDFSSMAVLNATTTGALITYTYFNIKPARFQMGDVGSLGLGALLAINVLVLKLIVVLPLLGFMFYIEALSVLAQVAVRSLFGKRVFKMAPIHHHFELKGWSEEKTIMRFWIIHLIFVVLGVWVAMH